MFACKERVTDGGRATTLVELAEGRHLTGLRLGVELIGLKDPSLRSG